MNGLVEGSKLKDKKPHTLPPDFKIEAHTTAWATTHGFLPYLQAHFEYFLDYARSNGKRYTDWEAALRNCVRADWGDVRKNAARSGVRPVAVADKSCVAIVDGQACGRPGELHGADYVCQGCYHKRMEKRVMPADTRAMLKQIGKTTGVSP